MPRGSEFLKNNSKKDFIDNIKRRGWIYDVYDEKGLEVFYDLLAAHPEDKELEKTVYELCERSVMNVRDRSAFWQELSETVDVLKKRYDVTFVNFFMIVTENISQELLDERNRKYWHENAVYHPKSADFNPEAFRIKAMENGWKSEKDLAMIDALIGEYKRQKNNTKSGKNRALKAMAEIVDNNINEKEENSDIYGFKMSVFSDVDRGNGNFAALAEEYSDSLKPEYIRFRTQEKKKSFVERAQQNGWDEEGDKELLETIFDAKYSPAGEVIPQIDQAIKADYGNSDASRRQYLANLHVQIREHTDGSPAVRAIRAKLEVIDFRKWKSGFGKRAVREGWQADEKLFTDIAELMPVKDDDHPLMQLLEDIYNGSIPGSYRTIHEERYPKTATKDVLLQVKKAIIENTEESEKKSEVLQAITECIQSLNVKEELQNRLDEHKRLMIGSYADASYDRKEEMIKGLFLNALNADNHALEDITEKREKLVKAFEMNEFKELFSKLADSELPGSLVIDALEADMKKLTDAIVNSDKEPDAKSISGLTAPIHDAVKALVGDKPVRARADRMIKKGWSCDRDTLIRLIKAGEAMPGNTEYRDLLMSVENGTAADSENREFSDGVGINMMTADMLRKAAALLEKENTPEAAEAKNSIDASLKTLAPKETGDRRFFEDRERFVNEASSRKWKMSSEQLRDLYNAGYGLPENSEYKKLLDELRSGVSMTYPMLRLQAGDLVSLQTKEILDRADSLLRGKEMTAAGAAVKARLDIKNVNDVIGPDADAEKAELPEFYRIAETSAASKEPAKAFLELLSHGKKEEGIYVDDINKLAGLDRIVTSLDMFTDRPDVNENTSYEDRKTADKRYMAVKEAAIGLIENNRDKKAVFQNLGQSFNRELINLLKHFGVKDTQAYEQELTEMSKWSETQMASRIKRGEELKTMLDRVKDGDTELDPFTDLRKAWMRLSESYKKDSFSVFEEEQLQKEVCRLAKEYLDTSVQTEDPDMHTVKRQNCAMKLLKDLDPEAAAERTAGLEEQRRGSEEVKELLKDWAEKQDRLEIILHNLEDTGNAYAFHENSTEYKEMVEAIRKAKDLERKMTADGMMGIEDALQEVSDTTNKYLTMKGLDRAHWTHEKSNIRRECAFLAMGLADEERAEGLVSEANRVRKEKQKIDLNKLLEKEGVGISKKERNSSHPARTGSVSEKKRETVKSK